MGVIDESLWEALATMRIEPEGAPLTFTRRLARENGWSRTYAAKVVEEYKRFLYLAATGTTSVTPSEQIDQAWHLHLAYTHHYWGELCARIIGRPLHHGPTAGGGAEGRRYRSLYAGTLQRYRDTFGAEPPSDIWPPTEVRFAGRNQWVDRSRYFIVPRRSVTIAGIAGGAVLLAACTALAADKVATASPPTLRPFFDMLFGTNAGLIGFVIGGTLLLFMLGMLIDRLRGRTASRGVSEGGPQRRRQLRERRDSGAAVDGGTDDWSFNATATAASAGGAAFVGAGGDFGGSGADGDWDSGAGSDGGDSGCSSGCGGCGGD